MKSKMIYKYPLVLTEKQSLAMPKNAEILDVQVQNNVIVLWALVDPETNDEVRKFEIFGTGVAMADVTRIYLGTVQKNGFVWHVFERT